MKILLVNPSMDTGTVAGWREPAVAPAPLMAVAGATPGDDEVSILDEVVEPLDLDAPAPDLVGISVKTQTAARAYRVADEYRRRGVPVVLGGIHATILPGEALRHADAVAVGEAEETWPRIVRDARAGRPRGIYRAEGFPSLDSLPLPRRDLVKQSKYLTVNTVQVTRGCPFGCDFCSVTRFYGTRCRARRTDSVLHEVAGLPPGVVFFTDDNFGGNPAAARELMRELPALRRRWISQTSLPSVQDDEFVDLAARSGCVGLLIGFESLSSENLRAMHKAQNRPDAYAGTVRRLHERGIEIAASVIVGLDGDPLSVFASTLEFASANRIEVLQVNVLTPFPGTDLYGRLRAEGRLPDETWWLTSPADYFGVHFRPRLISAEELRSGCLWLSRKFYSLPAIARRVVTVSNRSAAGLGLFLLVSLGYRQMFAHEHPAAGGRPA
jgi:radical SAM superfamily enzyme YgiQ (UPF0313 family)